MTLKTQELKPGGRSRVKITKATACASLILLTVGCMPARTQITPSAPSPQATPKILLERQALTIDFGDFQTKAELTFPASSAAPLPTVILIPGSGPEDLDASISSFDMLGKPVKLSSIFRDISDTLTPN